MDYFFNVLIIATLLFGGCRSSGKSQDSTDSNIAEETKSLKALALEKLGEGVKMESNDSGNLILCSGKTISQGLSFFVFDQTSDSILLERNGFVQYVRWHSDSTLLFKTIASNPTTDAINSEKIINVRTGQQSSPNKSR